MDNIGDWFYIVLFGVFGINALIASFAKKKGTNKFPDSMESDPQFDLETITESEEEEPISEPLITAQRESVSTPPKAVNKEQKHHSQYTPLSELRKTEQPSTPVVQLESSEDLKRAIICSEILNRKY